MGFASVERRQEAVALTKVIAIAIMADTNMSNNAAMLRVEAMVHFFPY